MMKSEFEKLVGRTVTTEQFEAIEKLYMESTLCKADFVKSIKPMLKSVPTPEHKKKIIMIGVTDRSGYRMTPNGCWYHTELAELVDVNIATGRMQVRKIPNSYDLRYADETYIWDCMVEFVA